MKRKQLAALFICNLAPYFVGNLLLALLPIYAIDLGASQTIAGIYLGLAFATLAIGTLLSGWLSDRFQRRKQMILGAACLAFPAGLMMGQVNTIALLTLFTMIVWFSGGVSTGMVSILTGIYAESDRRGRIFGVIGTTVALAQILGGLAGGRIVDAWGYTALFTVGASAMVIQALSALVLEDRVVVSDTDTPANANVSPMSRVVWLLIIASTLVGIAIFSTSLGRPLLMNSLEFDASAISNTIAVGGFVGLPMPFLLGWLSDRIGRKQMLIVCYLVATAGAAVLINAVSLWQFWLSMALFTISGAAGFVGSAFITDLVPQNTLGVTLTRYTSTAWIAGTLGFSVTGLLIETLGMPATFALNAALPLVGAALILAIRPAAVVADEMLADEPVPLG
jgi:MFS family permease